MRHYLDGHFILTADIDMDIAPYNTSQGWAPIGDYATDDSTSQFIGNFDGAGYSITGLYINRGSADIVGLFGYIYNGSITNLTVKQVNVVGNSVVGGLAGFSFLSTIDSSSVTGNVTGSTSVGGLVGVNSNSSLINSFTEVHVIGNGNSIGGLVGENGNGALITNSYSGGMAGAKVEGENNVGGLVGDNSDAKIVNSYATASIFGASYIGGLVGNSYYSHVENSYSTGSVSGSNDFAGFIGYSNGDNLSSNYWNTETSGQQTGANENFSKEGGIQEEEIAGLTSIQMANPDNFFDWNFENVWDITEGETYPWLQWQGGPTAANEAFYGPPGNLDATVVTDAEALTWEVELTWNTPALGKPDSYNIYRSGELLDVITVANPETPTASDTTWTDTTATNFKPYFYYVTAVYHSDEEEVESTPSNQVQVVVETGLPGTGTEEDPWHIAAPNELNALRYLSSGHFKLVQDIDLEEATADSTGMFWNGGNGWTPISGFEGLLDGHGYSISGLYINRQNSEGSGGTGFFLSLSSGEIRNLGLADVNITGASNVGGLSGSITSVTITNSFVTGTIQGGSNVGGLFGHIRSSASVSGCYTTGEIKGYLLVGGLTGNLEVSSIIADSYSMARVYGRERIGGLVGENNKGTIEGSYAAGSVEGLYETGGIVGYQMPGSPTLSSNFWDKEATEQQEGVSNIASRTNGLTTSKMVAEASFSGWDFETVWDIAEDQSYPWLRENMQLPPPVPDTSTITNAFAGGSGTEDDPWEIASATQLDSVRHYLRGHFILTADIDLDISPYNQGKGWQPIAHESSYTDLFTGSFDGNRHIISGLYINRPDQNRVGLFGYIGLFAVAQNIGVTDVDVTGKNSVGSLAGELYAGNISNTYATGKVKGSSRVGGLVGYHFSTNSFIRSSYADVHVSGTRNVGGLVGTNAWSAQISDSYAIGIVDGKEWTGGFAGSNRSASIFRSYAAGKVSADSSAGGFVGLILEGTFNNNFWDADSTTQNTGIGTDTSLVNNVTGLSSEQMQQPGSFNNWDFNSVWDINAGNSYPWLRQIPQDPLPGLIVGVEQESMIPREFGLAQNYPNPFNPSTVISYQLPIESKVSLQVFDVLGKQVATLVDGKIKAGYHRVTFNAGNLASGMYIYRLKAGSTIISKKFTLIK